MAFEAFLAAHDRWSRPSRAGGCGSLIALGAHAVPVIIVAVLGVRQPDAPRPVDARLADQSSGVSVRLVRPAPIVGPLHESAGSVTPRELRPAAEAADEAPHEERAAPRELAAGAAPNRRPRPERRAERRKKDGLRLEAMVRAFLAPAPHPDEARADAPDSAPGAPSAVVRSAAQAAARGGAVADTTAGFSAAGLGGSTLAAVAPRRRTTSAWPSAIEASHAKGLRVYETYPRLPRGLDRVGARYSALLDICVSARGVVSSVTLQEESEPELDRLLCEAVRLWRYTPFLEGGVPSPFCHPLRITYYVRK